MNTATATAMNLPAHASTAAPSNGARLVDTQGRTLPLVGTALRASASAGLARVVLEQTFRNPHAEPLRVTYSLPLPADAAVGGYAFRIGERRTVGVVQKRAEARERFEQAIVEGKTASLLEQDRSSLFHQEIGNIPPGAEVVIEVEIDQPLTWIAGGGWEWRFPTVVGPRYLGAPGRVSDGARVTTEVASEATDPQVRLDLVVGDRLVAGALPTSPSHAIATRPGADGVSIGLQSEQGAALDRDVVVRWDVAAAEPGCSVDLARREGDENAYALITVVPPAAEREFAVTARDLVVLVDVSGSMGGEPLEQAAAVVGAMIDTLAPQDRIELIAFSWKPERWKRRPVKATARNKKAAHAWLSALRAGGATEMKTGILEALRPLRADAQRQVVVVTDGLIGFESEIVETVSTALPAGSRLHMIGVGSSVNRSLTGPGARAGRGTELVIGLGEDPAPFAERMVAATSQPLVVDLALEGDVIGFAPAHLPDLYAGAPVTLAVTVPAAGGRVTIAGRTASGRWSHTLDIEPMAGGGSASVPRLFARERVEDLEIELAAAHERAPIDAEIERLGVEFQIATRLTSWVAVDDQPNVDPRDPARAVTMPQMLPHGMSAEGVGLRGAAVPVMFQMMAGAAAPAAMVPTGLGQPAPLMAASPKKAKGGRGRARRAMERSAAPPPPPAQASEGYADDVDLDDEMAIGGGGPDVFDAAPEEEQAKERAPEPRVARSVTTTGGAVPLRGRVVLRADGRVTIEFDVAFALTWKTPRELELETSKGIVTVGVVADRTTRDGELAAGTTGRITLDVSALADTTLIQGVRLLGSFLTIEIAAGS